MLVNLLGNPNDFDAIKELIKGKDIQIIEDNCESLGSKYKEKFTGTFGLCGHLVLFSHHISTMEGGVIATNNYEIYQIFITSSAWMDKKPA